MRILAVEDDEKIAHLIKDGMKHKGYAVDLIDDGEKAMGRIQLNWSDYDAIILDLGLPKKGGLEICKELREMGVSTPVLVLTGEADVKSKVTLFNAGADDYLTKPFAFEELLSRIQALTRRPKKVLPSELTIADIVLNPATQKVTRAGKEVKFTLREFRILEYFMRNPDVVLSREEITSNIWDFNYDSFSNVLDVFISKIRNKIDKDRAYKLIETIQGVGYRLNSKAQ